MATVTLKRLMTEKIANANWSYVFVTTARPVEQTSHWRRYENQHVISPLYLCYFAERKYTLAIGRSVKWSGEAAAWCRRTKVVCAQARRVEHMHPPRWTAARQTVARLLPEQNGRSQSSTPRPQMVLCLWHMCGHTQVWEFAPVPHVVDSLNTIMYQRTIRMGSVRFSTSNSPCSQQVGSHPGSSRPDRC